MSKFYKNIPESESFCFVLDKGLISTLKNFSFYFLGFESLKSEKKYILVGFLIIKIDMFIRLTQMIKY